jgi:hypothetical protein
VPQDVEPDVAAQLVEAFERADAQADWLVWGSGMSEPCLCTALTGEKTVTSDRRIIVAVRHAKGLPKGSPGQAALARRIAACVNALAGCPEPEETIALVRSVLLDLARGEADRGDTRVVAALARLIPPHELEGFRSDEP